MYKNLKEYKLFIGSDKIYTTKPFKIFNKTITNTSIKLIN